MAVLEVMSQFAAHVDKEFGGSVKKDTALLSGGGAVSVGGKGGEGEAHGGKGVKALSDNEMLAVLFRRFRV
jgi:hypothetical protein